VKDKMGRTCNMNRKTAAKCVGETLKEEYDLARNMIKY